MEKVICKKCEWDWVIEKDDKNPYLCHKCGFDNKLNKYDYNSFNIWKNKNNPYNEEITNNCITRTFSEKISEDELIWHMDRQDRRIEILSECSWYLQFDNKLPIKMNKGDEFFIPKNTYHRIIKESGDLKINIYLK